jgi:hypothetical protein
MIMLDQKTLKKMLNYDPETGEFTWIMIPNNTIKLGRIAGKLMPNGYTNIRVKKRNYYAHRLAFLWMTGKFPKETVDHINHNKSDNRWNNLRPASYSENMINVKITTRNTSGCKGVYWHKGAQKWCARGTKNKITTSLGLFTCLKEASKRFKDWQKENFGDFVFCN